MASLKKLVEKLTQVAFDSIGDLNDTVNYVQYVTGDYDFDLSAPSYTYNTQSGISGLFTTFTEQEKDNSILVLKDKKLLIPSKSFHIDLIDASEDYVIDGNYKQWNVIKYIGITGGSMHIFHVRRA
jgi:hypothetical protein